MGHFVQAFAPLFAIVTANKYCFSAGQDSTQLSAVKYGVDRESKAQRALTLTALSRSLFIAHSH